MQYDPFRIIALAPPPAEVMAEAVAEARARGGRLFVLAADKSESARARPCRRADARAPVREWPGVERLLLIEAAPQTASGA